MKLCSLEIEGMHNVDKVHYDFDRMTYLYGNNGVGKSTVLKAIQLVLLGYIPGTNKSKSAIFKHCNGNLMKISAKFEDNNQPISITRCWMSTFSGVEYKEEFSGISSEQLHEFLGDCSLPVWDLSEFLSLSANKLKDKFLSMLPEAESTINWVDELTNTIESPSLRKYAETNMIKPTISYLNTYANTSNSESCVKFANDYFKSQISAKTAECKRLADSLQSLILYEDISSSADIQSTSFQIASLKSEQSQLTEDLTKCAHLSTIKFQLDTLKDIPDNDSQLDAMLDHLSKRNQDLEKHLNHSTSQLDELSSKQFELVKKISEISAEIISHDKILNSGGICPYTDTECDSIAKMCKQETAVVKRLNLVKTGLEQQLKDITAKQTEIQKDANQIELSIKEISASMEDIRSKYETKVQLKSKLTDSITLTEDELRDRLVRCNEKLDELQTVLNKLIANESTSKLIDSITQDKNSADLQLQVYKLWEKLTNVNGLQSNSSGFDYLKQVSTRYVSSLFGDSASIEFILSKQSNSFDFGLFRQNFGYVSYSLLSSGEQCKYILALLLSLLEISNPKLPLLLLDDSFDHLDDYNASKVLESLYNVSGIQMIFAGVKQITSKNSDKFVFNVLESNV